MTSSAATPRVATMDDLVALPEGVKGEIIDGVLYTQPRPRGAHQRVIFHVAESLVAPFDRGRGGPGGWIILVEPGIVGPRSPEYSPDIAGWRRERMQTIPDGRIDIAPDWVCEVLSVSTSAYDQTTKRRFYARIGVAHYWLVDVDARVLTVLRNEGGRWVDGGVFAGNEVVNAEPFEIVQLPLEAWWRDLPTPPAPT